MVRTTSSEELYASRKRVMFMVDASPVTYKSSRVFDESDSIQL